MSEHLRAGLRSSDLRGTPCRDPDIIHRPVCLFRQHRARGPIPGGGTVKHLTLPGRKFSAPSRQRESDSVSPSNDLALEFESVDAGYGRVPVLKQVTFALRKGTVAALLGPNGAGKTTLLRVASGLLR